MILTCPSCGTQYVVKDGAIPPGGRQVRCASCKHSWHQDPEESVTEDEAPEVPAQRGTVEEDSPSIPEEALIEPRSGPEAEERAYEAAQLTDADDEPEGAYPAEPVAEEQQFDEVGGYDETPPAEEPPAIATDDDFSPFSRRYEDDEPKRRSPLVTLLLLALLIAALAAAFWFLAPAAWKERLGIASASDTPLQLMMTHSDRQKLASGNELLAVSGRVINPTEESQRVPPIQAQLRSASGQVVHSWTIPPPALTLPPGASAPFNSAEVNVPSGGDELTITLGAPRA